MKVNRVMFRINTSKSWRPRVFLACLLGTALLLLSDCAGKRPSGRSKVPSDERLASGGVKCARMKEENQRLERVLTEQTAARQELEKKMAKLQLDLMKKEIQAEEPFDREVLLQKKLDEAIQEVVRAKAKLRSLESKAEAASSIAEAEVALKDLKAKTAGQARVPEIARADYLLEMSAQEFKRENYSGALYLTSQAKSLVRMGEERLTNQNRPPRKLESVSFIVPVRLEVLKRSNVRQGPGLEFKVLFVADKGSSVIGYSYNGQWVRVKSGDGRHGWIFHTLVDGH